MTTMSKRSLSPPGDNITIHIGHNVRYVAAGKNVVQIVLGDRVIELGPERCIALLAEYRAPVSSFRNCSYET